MTAGRADERAETIRHAHESLDAIESRLAGPDAPFAGWGSHIAVIRDALVSLSAELEQQRQALAAAQQALTEAHSALYRARCGLDLGVGCARDLGDDERLRAQLEYLDDARGQWRATGDALAALSAGAANMPRAVLDFDKGEVRTNEQFTTEGTVGTTEGHGGGPSPGGAA